MEGEIEARELVRRRAVGRRAGGERAGSRRELETIRDELEHLVPGIRQLGVDHLWEPILPQGLQVREVAVHHWREGGQVRLKDRRHRRHRLES